MRVKLYGAKAFWCQVPRIADGFRGLGHAVVKDGEEYDFIYANNPPYDIGDEEHKIPPLDLPGFKIFNVLDVPVHDKNYNFDKLGEQLLKADLVTCMGELALSQLKEIYNINAVIIGQPVKDVFLDRTINKKLNGIFVGRARDSVKRFPLLRKINEEYEVVTVGNEQPIFGAYVGPKTDTELNLYYNSSKFVFSLTTIEGLPALEGIICGAIPIVCSDNKISSFFPSFCIAEPSEESVYQTYKKINNNYDSYREFILEQYSFRIQKMFSKFQIARNIINSYRDCKKINLPL